MFIARSVTSLMVPIVHFCTVHFEKIQLTKGTQFNFSHQPMKRSKTSKHPYHDTHTHTQKHESSGSTGCFLTALCPRGVHSLSTPGGGSSLSSEVQQSSQHLLAHKATSITRQHHLSPPLLPAHR